MTKRTVGSNSSRQRGWTYLTNHALVLMCVAGDPYVKLLQIAERVGITDRAVQKILADLESEGVIERVKEGRCNRYVVNVDLPLRHRLVTHRTVGQLLVEPEHPSETEVGLGRDG